MISLPSVLFLSALLLSPTLAQTPEAFLWDKLTPSQDFNWVQCYSTYQCTRLEVPLDYSDPSVGTAVLAVIRIPANVSEAEYRGPIIFNPGGPGGSGVDILVTGGFDFQTLLADSRYDLVSFDPRGVRYSTPVATAFETAAERALWNAGTTLSLSASSNAIPQAWGRAHLFGTLVAERDQSQIFKYMSTDNVARDMLLITQKFGFEKLRYYGISYGTVLGATFATLFPDKVDRMVIDGVVDADGWYTANVSIQGTDSDKALQTFFDACADAGPDLCAFYEPSATAIADRLEALTNAIRAQPVPVITPTSYGLVDYSLLRATIFEVLFRPYGGLASALAEGLSQLEKGNGTVLYSIFSPPAFECNCNGAVFPPGDDAAVGLECGDSVLVTDTIEQATEIYENALKPTQFAEFLVGSFRMSCAGWKVHRDDRFLGPVGANTSFPLLLVTNTVDPITPKVAALKVQAAFPGSMLLTQNSTGHTSLSGPSVCTFGYLQGYFVNGTLPPPGTVCAIDEPWFSPPANSTAKRAVLNADDERVLAGARVLRDAVLPAIMRR
ncbi:Alpha/Beta hydrolase protein [Mycena polygramma]|nr:Alpha/Beta hydrolase protein [Mycena polygramma]